MASLLDLMNIEATPMAEGGPMQWGTDGQEYVAEWGVAGGPGKAEPKELEIVDPEILKLVQSGQLQAHVESADQRTDFRGQANLEMYTAEAIHQRKMLKKNPYVIRAVYRWWLFLGGGEFNLKTGYLRKTNYIDMCTLTEQVMDPENYDEESSKEGASEEWDKKYGADVDEMYWDEFFDEIFEMVDLWTDDTSERTYCDFLRRTLKKVERLRTKVAEEFMRANTGLAESELKDEIRKWDPYGEKAAHAALMAARPKKTKKKGSDSDSDSDTDGGSASPTKSALTAENSQADSKAAVEDLRKLSDFSPEKHRQRESPVLREVNFAAERSKLRLSADLLTEKERQLLVHPKMPSISRLVPMEHGVLPEEQNVRARLKMLAALKAPQERRRLGDLPRGLLYQPPPPSPSPQPPVQPTPFHAGTRQRKVASGRINAYIEGSSHAEHEERLRHLIALRQQDLRQSVDVAQRPLSAPPEPPNPYHGPPRAPRHAHAQNLRAAATRSTLLQMRAQSQSPRPVTPVEETARRLEEQRLRHVLGLSGAGRIGGQQAGTEPEPPLGIHQSFAKRIANARIHAHMRNQSARAARSASMRPNTARRPTIAAPRAGERSSRSPSPVSGFTGRRRWTEMVDEDGNHDATFGAYAEHRATQEVSFDHWGHPQASAHPQPSPSPDIIEIPSITTSSLRTQSGVPWRQTTASVSYHSQYPSQPSGVSTSRLHAHTPTLEPQGRSVSARSYRRAPARSRSPSSATAGPHQRPRPQTAFSAHTEQLRARGPSPSPSPSRPDRLAPKASTSGKWTPRSGLMGDWTADIEPVPADFVMEGTAWERDSFQTLTRPISPMMEECVRNAWASEHLRGVMRRAEDSAAAEAAMEDAFTRAERHLREHLHETTDGHEDA